jgi:hypothetical protein
MSMPTADNANMVEIKNNQIRIYCNRNAFSKSLIEELHGQGLVLAQYNTEFFLVTHRNDQPEDFWVQLAEYLREQLSK